MSGHPFSSWFYPSASGDQGRDRAVRTLHFACLLFALAIVLPVALDVISREPVPWLMVSGVLGALAAAAVLNRAGKTVWAGRIVVLALLVCAVLRVIHASDGFRSHAMLMFPGVLLLSVMLLDRASYLATAGLVIISVAALGIAEQHQLIGSIPPTRTLANYESIFLMELMLLAFSAVGSRIVQDAQRNRADLHSSIGELSSLNTDLVKAADTLSENERRLFSIYNTVRDVIFHLAVESEDRYRFIFVNSAFLEVTGLTEQAVIGKDVRDVIPEPSLTVVLEKYRQAIAERATVLWEETSDYPAGRVTGDVSVAPVFDDNGVCTHLAGSVHDITERKRAEAALRESELRYREIFDNFSECIFVLDVTPDGRFRVAGFNPAEERATGKLNSEVTGKFIEEVLPEETARRVISHYRRCLEVGTLINYDEELNMPIGPRYFHTNLIPLRDETGRIHRIVGCCLDFTDLKRSQEEALARQKLESVGTLASGIAHDFNNLLGAVLAQADLALAEYASGASPATPLKTIRDLAVRGSEIVQQLMIYAGNESDLPELVNISSVIEGMLGLLKLSVSKHAVLQTDLGLGLRAVRCRPAQVRQIVMNLVTNASEAIHDRDGAIRVTTRRVTVDSAAGATHGIPEGDYVELAVADTGVGMSLETRARVFDPFFSTKSAGRGLGLWVVHGIVRSLDGAIRIESEPGNGATVHVFLPCAGQSAEVTINPVSAAGRDATPSGKFTVMVVEDEDSLRDAVVKMLRREGFGVYEASTGSAAIDLLRAHSARIDLILLDMTIPGAPSPEVIAEVARIRPDIRVIVTSAYSQEMLVDKLNASQISAFIRKPFRLAELVKMLQEAVVS